MISKYKKTTHASAAHILYLNEILGRLCNNPFALRAAYMRERESVILCCADSM